MVLTTQNCYRKRSKKSQVDNYRVGIIATGFEKCVDENLAFVGKKKLFEAKMASKTTRFGFITSRDADFPSFDQKIPTDLFPVSCKSIRQLGATGTLGSLCLVLPESHPSIVSK
jgi:hypothetical protein